MVSILIALVLLLFNPDCYSRILQHTKGWYQLSLCYCERHCWVHSVNIVRALFSLLKNHTGFPVLKLSFSSIQSRSLCSPWFSLQVSNYVQQFWWKVSPGPSSKQYLCTFLLCKLQSLHRAQYAFWVPFFLLSRSSPNGRYVHPFTELLPTRPTPTSHWNLKMM